MRWPSISRYCLSNATCVRRFSKRSLTSFLSFSCLGGVLGIERLAWPAKQSRASACGARSAQIQVVPLAGTSHAQSTLRWTLGLVIGASARFTQTTDTKQTYLRTPNRQRPWMRIPWLVSLVLHPEHVGPRQYSPSYRHSEINQGDTG